MRATLVVVSSICALLSIFAAPPSAATNPAKALKFADHYQITVPADIAVEQIGPNVAIQNEAYRLQPKTSGEIDVFVLPYQTSKTDIPGKCTVSDRLDKGDPEGPIFCEGIVLSHLLRTRAGIAKWAGTIEDATAAMRTAMSPNYVPPPDRRYGHSHVLAVPIKKGGVIIEFYLSELGSKEHAGTPGHRSSWPLLLDRIAPSLDTAR